MSDICNRLRRWTHAADAAPACDLMEEAAAAIVTLRSRSRFYENVVRSGAVAALTAAEREAIDAASVCPLLERHHAALRGLLERLG